MFFRVKHCSLWYVIPAVGGEGQPDDLEKICRPRAVNFFWDPLADGSSKYLPVLDAAIR